MVGVLGEAVLFLTKYLLGTTMLWRKAPLGNDQSVCMRLIGERGEAISSRTNKSLSQQPHGHAQRAPSLLLNCAPPPSPPLPLSSPPLPSCPAHPSLLIYTFVNNSTRFYNLYLTATAIIIFNLFLTNVFLTMFAYSCIIFVVLGKDSTVFKP